MVVDAEKEGAKWAQDDDPRITRVGKFTEGVIYFVFYCFG
jgi:lipopolysaccharide/colanic/teichoic acid biosynthesis glycosyltransferase